MTRAHQIKAQGRAGTRRGTRSPEAQARRAQGPTAASAVQSLLAYAAEHGPGRTVEKIAELPRADRRRVVAMLASVTTNSLAATLAYQLRAAARRREEASS